MMTGLLLSIALCCELLSGMETASEVILVAEANLLEELVLLDTTSKLKPVLCAARELDTKQFACNGNQPD